LPLSRETHTHTRGGGRVVLRRCHSCGTAAQRLRVSATFQTFHGSSERLKLSLRKRLETFFHNRRQPRRREIEKCRMDFFFNYKKNNLRALFAHIYGPKTQRTRDTFSWRDAEKQTRRRKKKENGKTLTLNVEKIQLS